MDSDNTKIVFGRPELYFQPYYFSLLSFILQIVWAEIILF